MDKLIAYLNSLEKQARTQFAADCGTSENYMRKARSSGQKFRSELCVRIERVSKGQVTRKDLRSDWAEVWPELITPGSNTNGMTDRAAASDDTQPPVGDTDIGDTQV